MNGNDMLEWEEEHIEDLTEKFINRYISLWDALLEEEYESYLSGMSDYYAEMRAEEEYYEGKYGSEE